MSFPLNQHLKYTDSIIANQTYRSAKIFAVIDPATDELVTHVSSVDNQGILLALESAQSAFEQLKVMPTQARSELLMRWYQLVVDNTDALAEIMTLEQGKPLAEARGEVAYGAEFIRWFAEEAKRSYGQVIPSNNQHQRLSTIKQPVGVVLGITPWNFPIAMITRKVAPAIAAGCSFILKPSELTPLSALSLAHLAIEAGFPSGALNVVLTQDAPSVVEQLLNDRRVKKVTFTGSTQVGKVLLQQAAASVKRVSMELGGNAPFIVFESAAISKAISGLMASKFRNAGQTCVATNRVLVAKSIYTEFLKQLLSEVAKLRVGSGFEPSNHIGPLISKAAKQRLISTVEQALNEGACFVFGQAEFEQAKQRADNFFPVVVLGNITPNMAIYHQELFGPVVLLSTFESEDHALAMANETDYGLAAYFYTENINQMQRVSEGLDFGMVGINEGLISNPIAPFGGVKHSGIGREGGQMGLDEYLQVKYQCLNIN